MGDEIIRGAQEEPLTRREIGRTSACQVNHALEVIRLREQIDQMNLLDPVATCQQNHEIARQRYRIA